MLLTIDIGNTNLTLGLYEGNNLVAHWRLATDHARMPDEYGLQFQGLLENAKHDKRDLTGICLASVVPQLTSRVVQAWRGRARSAETRATLGFPGDGLPSHHVFDRSPAAPVRGVRARSSGFS